MIIVLSNKIQELSDETEPLQKRKLELENTVKNAYNELIHEFNNNKKLDLDVESYDNKIRVIGDTININTKLLNIIQVRVGNILRELQRLSQTSLHEIAGVSKKVNIILNNLSILVNSKTAKEVEKHPLKFPKPVTPPWKTTNDKNDINMYTEVEL